MIRAMGTSLSSSLKDDCSREYEFKTMSLGITSIGVLGTECVVFCTEKQMVPESITHVFNVSEREAARMTGLLPDAQETDDTSEI